MIDDDAVPTTTKARITCPSCGDGPPKESCRECGGQGTVVITLTREYLTRWVRGYGLKAVKERWIGDWETRP